MSMIIRSIVALVTMAASPLQAQQAPVTVNSLEGRSLSDIADALGPVVIDGLELRSFTYGRPSYVLGSPGSAIAVFDYLSSYAENGVCVLDQWWVSFVPEVEYGPEMGSGNQRMPRELLSSPRDGALRLTEISPAAIYWIARRDLEAEFPMADDGVYDDADREVYLRRVEAAQSLCDDPPDGARFFGSTDKETASRGMAAVRRVVAALERDPDTLRIECPYSADICTELRSQITLDQLMSITRCNDGRSPDDSCIDFRVGATGGGGQGSYTRVNVRTTSDFETPEDFSIYLESRSYVAH